ncbi:MAG: hypothetical protein IKX86_03560 [Clostridia bacterium]|nr:hypothetical protein [Clostridia bacterium]
MNINVFLDGLKLSGVFWIVFALAPLVTVIFLKIRDAVTYDRLSGAATGKKKRRLLSYALLSLAASFPGVIIFGMSVAYNIYAGRGELVVVLIFDLLGVIVIFFTQPVMCLIFGNLDRKYRGEVVPPVPGKAISSVRTHNFFLSMLTSLSMTVIIALCVLRLTARSVTITTPIIYIVAPILAVLAAVWIKNILNASIEKKYRAPES